MKGILFAGGLVVLGMSFICVTAFNPSVTSGVAVLTSGMENVPPVDPSKTPDLPKADKDANKEDEGKGGMDVTMGGFGPVPGSAADQVEAAVAQLKIAIEGGNQFSIDRQFMVLKTALADAPELARDVPKEVFAKLSAEQQAALKQLAALAVAGGVGEIDAQITGLEVAVQNIPTYQPGAQLTTQQQTEFDRAVVAANSAFEAVLPLISSFQSPVEGLSTGDKIKNEEVKVYYFGGNLSDSEVYAYVSTFAPIIASQGKIAVIITDGSGKEQKRAESIQALNTTIQIISRGSEATKARKAELDKGNRKAAYFSNDDSTSATDEGIVTITYTGPGGIVGTYIGPNFVDRVDVIINSREEAGRKA